MIWFWWWLLFVLILLIIPLSYGWGYRGWGAPYPSYYERRRTAAGARGTDPADPDVVVVDDPAAEEATGWGVLADVLWVVVIVALVWLLLGLLLSL